MTVIGVQLQMSGLPGSMCVDEAMRFFCAYHGVAPRYDLLQRLGLGDKMKAQYMALSTGLKRRLALALAVAHNPPVVFLDEPTAGLDVGSRTELHAMMEELQAGGTTIILATHDMAEAEKMAAARGHPAARQDRGNRHPRELTATGSSLTKVSVHTENGCLAQQRRRHSLPSARASSETNTSSTTAVTPVPRWRRSCLTSARQGDKLIDLRVERPSRWRSDSCEITQGQPTWPSRHKEAPNECLCPALFLRVSRWPAQP